MSDGEKPSPVPVSDRLVATFTPADLPPIGPDGGPILSPATLTELRILPPSVCGIGPCRHFHVLVTSLDAQEPLGEETGVPQHRNTVRTCYPSPGVELDLAEAVIFECSRWDPEDVGFVAARNLRRQQVRLASEVTATVDLASD